MQSLDAEQTVVISRLNHHLACILQCTQAGGEHPLLCGSSGQPEAH